ncbi:TetR/AcrR family transcriptional regulator [Oleiagrimonas soli]|uniref:TetR/AcrR family transcriptional repressor of nem operon n=1 Tax=Oleiagrimonas soli TaxID=1543381 RepID=A0A099CWA0_9GAMM|nr:TetR/AcrR family transcriptional regulator [Oleiagrimonas soli]KGI78253.1 hypothetical protein LF63_0107980 [Oleiagrimonas soli]MBB6183272.1 TetR/AcrR family transcriptional repressor of nem operon [Oleiagrimonas soli]
MKNSQEKKQQNRQLILGAAARLFRERGIHGVSVSDVMQEAGMTHGGFYRHFADKDELVVQAIASALDPSSDDHSRPKPDDILQFAEAYLSIAHRDDAGTGCVFAALGTELVRGSAPGRHVMTKAMQRRIESFTRTGTGETSTERRQAAIGSWAAMVGAVVLSRLSDDPALADELLSETAAWIAAGQKTASDRPAR